MAKFKIIGEFLVLLQFLKYLIKYQNLNYMDYYLGSLKVCLKEKQKNRILQKAHKKLK